MALRPYPESVRDYSKDISEALYSGASTISDKV
ncbi:MAG: hypothetical protein HLUCCA11_23040 [Phormidesmis priestleyi Ana]|uniref:Uncharacterized protein n=1 Tax=Phormidesmis priestleyi Ana TaxID=1666911 RepID=A0A0P7ZAR2_9CYAN|nr:MAG: hypothetical protein HLUCCA11_23040 [Phormidesmis priestleyi Ana]